MFDSTHFDYEKLFAYFRIYRFVNYISFSCLSKSIIIGYAYEYVYI